MLTSSFALLAAVVIGAAVPVPAASPSPVPLPEIGRVRATNAACAVMRDLTIPSFRAAHEGDLGFAAMSKRLDHYADILDDPDLQRSAAREMTLSQLDHDAMNLVRTSNAIKGALRDPRFAGSNDPLIAAQKTQLEQLADVQAERARLSFEFVQRQQNDIATLGLGDNSAFAGPRAPAPAASSTPVPGSRTIPGMPVLRGLGDRNALSAWTTRVDAATRGSENQAARTFLGIAKDCR